MECVAASFRQLHQLVRQACCLPLAGPSRGGASQASDHAKSRSAQASSVYPDLSPRVLGASLPQNSRPEVLSRSRTAWLLTDYQSYEPDHSQLKEL